MHNLKYLILYFRMILLLIVLHTTVIDICVKYEYGGNICRPSLVLVNRSFSKSNQSSLTFKSCKFPKGELCLI